MSKARGLLLENKLGKALEDSEVGGHVLYFENGERAFSYLEIERTCVFWLL